MDEVVTPWPCFVIAVRDEVLEKYTDLLSEMCKVVNKRAQKVKNDADTVEVISWRYNLRSDQVEKWLYETDWNYEGKEFPLTFEKTIEYLVKLDLLKPEQTVNWQEKLF